MTDWPTIKVPAEDKEKAKEYKPEDVTWGDVVVAGAERLNDQLESDPAPKAPSEGHKPTPQFGTVTTKSDLESVREQLDRIESSAETAEERTGRIERQLEDLEGRR